MFEDILPMKTEGTVVKIHEDGREELLIVFTNDLVTTVGKEAAASHHANSAPGSTWFTKLALGTGESDESTEDVALDAEIYVVVLDSVSASGASVYGLVTITATDIGADIYVIKEIGLKNVLDVLIARQVFETAITFTGAEQIAFQWKVIEG